MRTRPTYWFAVSLSAMLACSSSSSKEGSALGVLPPSPDQSQFVGQRAASPNTAPASSSAVPSAANPATRAPVAPAGAASAAGSGAPGLPPPAAQVDTRREKFTDVGSNPFVLVEHDPFSTFAADVDTASYDIFRRNVEHGLLTTPTSVRVEEFLNYFQYDYAAPTDSDEHPFRVSTAATQNPFGRDTVLVRVGIQAKDPAPAQKQAANLVFLIDVSGSMQTEDKLPLVQYLLTQSLDVLDADDKVSIVTYAGDTAVRLSPTSVVEKDKISAAVNGLAAGGSTNGAGGIQLAYQQAEAAFVQGAINHVILCTDGDFNVGISSTDALVDLIKEKRKTGITLTALGFGIGNLNDAMMEKVSNAGNGMYSVITSRTQASRYAEDRMLRTFVHVAKDMKIQLEWNPAHVAAYRLIGYEDRAIADQDFRNDVVDAGEVGAGHRVTALYEVVPKGKAIPSISSAPAIEQGEPVTGDRQIRPADMVLVNVRYKQPGAAESDPAREVGGSIPASSMAAPFAQADDDLRWAAALAAYAEILKQSPYATPDKLDAIREVFAAQQDRDIERKEFLGLFDKAKTFLPPQR